MAKTTHAPLPHHRVYATYDRPWRSARYTYTARSINACNRNWVALIKAGRKVAAPNTLPAPAPYDRRYPGKNFTRVATRQHPHYRKPARMLGYYMAAWRARHASAS